MSEPIRISIGSEPSQRIAADVLRSSILRRTSRPVEFTASWTPEHGWHPLMIAAPRLRGTKFSLWRWICPQLHREHGRVLYLDADQIVLADIAELWDSVSEWNDFDEMACVKNAVGVFGNKIPELGHVQTSVMLMDLEYGRCGWDSADLFGRVQLGQLSYKDLMQAAWHHGDRPDRLIHELSPAWNHFGIVTPETKLCHWSHVASQPYRNKLHPTADVWQRELFATIEAGHLTPEVLKEECDRGHVDDIYFKRWKERR